MRSRPTSESARSWPDRNYATIRPCPRIRVTRADDRAAASRHRRDLSEPTAPRGRETISARPIQTGGEASDLPGVVFRNA